RVASRREPRLGERLHEVVLARRQHLEPLARGPVPPPPREPGRREPARGRERRGRGQHLAPGDPHPPSAAGAEKSANASRCSSASFWTTARSATTTTRPSRSTATTCVLPTPWSTAFANPTRAPREGPSSSSPTSASPRHRRVPSHANSAIFG